MTSSRHAALVLCCFTSACAGSGEGLDANGRPLDEGGAVGGAITAEFDSIQTHVFTPICTVCHAGASAPQGLRLDSANSYMLLVGAPSTEVPDVLRVSPGDPDGSYLVQKIEGRAAVGARMPLGGPPLSADAIAAIRQWISDGAQRTPAASTVTLSMTASVPASGESIAPASPLFVEFNAPLDRSRIDAGTVRLRRIDSMEEAPALFTTPAANERALIITPREALRPGVYELTTGGAGGALRGVDGQTLSTSSASGPLVWFLVEAQP